MRGHEKPIYRGACLKRGLGQFSDLKGGWAWQERVGLLLRRGSYIINSQE